MFGFRKLDWLVDQHVTAVWDHAVDDDLVVFCIMLSFCDDRADGTDFPGEKNSVASVPITACDLRLP